MKKLTTIIMALVLIFLLTACAVPETAPNETDVPFTVTEAFPEENISPDTEVFAPATESAYQQITSVAITLDNWEEYFELRQTEQVYLSESCNVINRVFGYGVFLKEEFLPLVALGSDVSFELQYEVVWKRVLGDVTGNSYLIQNISNEFNQKSQTASLTDFRNDLSISEESDFYGQVAAEFAFDSEFSA